MKINWWWFLTGYVLFYLLVNFSFALPNEFDGSSIAVLLRNSSRGAWWRLTDTGLWFLLSFVPYLILTRRYTKNKLQCFLLLVIIMPIVFLFRFYCDRLIANHPIPLNVYLFKNSYFLVCFNLYAIVFFFIQYAHYKALQAKELLIQSRQSELALLRSQVNPHFLFNNLNNIYSLVYDKSEYALPAIAGLSDLLRYTLYEIKEKVPLEKEIDYIKKYINLQKLRFEEPLNVNLLVNDPAKGTTIQPLLLIPFVENAFKYGSLNDSQEELLIAVESNPEKIIFHCRNKKGTHQKDTTAGIGLQNVKRRLELLYPGKHSLSILDKGGYFDIRLIILNEI